MGVTRQDLIRSGQWLEKSDEDWAKQLESVNQALSGYLSNDEWAVKIKKNVAVLLTSSSYGRAYLKGSLETHKKLGFWTVLAYDNFVRPEWPQIDFNQWMPAKDVIELADSVILPHHQNWGGVSYPYMWLIRLGSAMLQEFEFVLCSNGDCILEKPEGFPQLIEMIGDADILSAGPTLEREIGTASFLVRGKAFAAIAKHMIDHVVPFEEYEKSTQEFGNTEGRLAVAVRDLGLKVAKVPVDASCPSHKLCEQHHVPSGTFNELVGFRHIHGEHNYAYRYKGVPPHPKYFDPRFLGDEYNQIVKYHELINLANITDLNFERAALLEKAQTVLEGWWAKD